MKICIATHIDRVGGIHTFLNNLINYWPQKKDKFDIIINLDFPEKKFFFKNIKKLNGKTEFIFFLPNFLFFKIIIMPFNLIYLYFKFIKFFIKKKFDKLILVSGGYPLSLPNKIILLAWCSVMSSRDVIINIHNLNTPSSWKNFFFDYLIDKFISKFKLKLILVSNACINSIKKDRKILSKHKNFKILYNGISSAEKFYKNKIKKNFYYSCLMLSTYEERKGHKFLFKVINQALKKISNIKLFIYGDDAKNQIPKLNSYIFANRLDKNIKLNKFSKNKYNLLKKSDVLIVPSQSHESFGLVIIEAMSLGIPVIANDIGGIREVISSKKVGVLVKKNSVKEFSDKLIQILKSKTKRKNIIKYAKKHYEKNFTAYQMSKNYYKEINKSK